MVGVHLFEQEISLRVRRVSAFLFIDADGNLRARNGLLRDAVEHVTRHIGIGFFLRIAGKQLVVLIEQDIIVGSLRLAENAVERPAVPIPIGARRAAQPVFIHLTERNADGVFLFNPYLSVGNHDLHAVPFIGCLHAVVEGAVEEYLVVDKPVPISPAAARALHDTGLAVNAEVDLIIVVLRLQAAVGKRVEIDLDTVAAGNRVVVSVSVRQQDRIFHFEKEEQRVVAAICFHRSGVAVAEGGENGYVFPLFVVPFSVDRKFGRDVVSVEVELTAARFFIGSIVLVGIVLIAGVGRIASASRRQQRKCRDQHCRTNPFFSHFLPPVSVLFSTVFPV